jgi:hypothetical protein
MLSRDGTFEHARHNVMWLIVESADAGPYALAHIARAMRDVHDGLRPFQLTHTAPHAIKLCVEAGHSTRYERHELVEAACRRVHGLLSDLSERLTPALAAPEVETASLGL